MVRLSKSLSFVAAIFLACTSAKAATLDANVAVTIGDDQTLRAAIAIAQGSTYSGSTFTFVDDLGNATEVIASLPAPFGALDPRPFFILRLNGVGVDPATNMNFQSATTLTLFDLAGNEVGRRFYAFSSIASGSQGFNLDVAEGTRVSRFQIAFSDPIVGVGSGIFPFLPPTGGAVLELQVTSADVVVASPVSPVPLPAGLPLLLASLGGVALLRRAKPAK